MHEMFTCPKIVRLNPFAFLAAAISNVIDLTCCVELKPNSNADHALRAERSDRW